jgi:hypothetical protein
MVVVVVTARRWRMEQIFCYFEYVTETNGVQLLLDISSRARTRVRLINEEERAGNVVQAIVVDSVDSR